MKTIQETNVERGKRIGCYCGLWDTKPSVYKKQGLPPGYCGFCERCGEPGHTRHFPGAVPYTGTWCEKHYLRLKWFHPLGVYGWRLYVILILVFIAMIFWTI